MSFISTLFFKYIPDFYYYVLCSWRIIKQGIWLYHMPFFCKFYPIWITLIYALLYSLRSWVLKNFFFAFMNLFVLKVLNFIAKCGFVVGSFLWKFQSARGVIALEWATKEERTILKDSSDSKFILTRSYSYFTSETSKIV
jgi:hypothetical protein